VRRSALSARVFAVLGFLVPSACAHMPAEGSSSPLAPPQAAASAAASADLGVCLRNVLSAIDDSWFMCSLASAGLAHEEAGRAAMGNADCLSSPEICEAPDISLVVRVLFSPPVVSVGPPRASSIELAGFDHPRAHADMRELAGPEDWYTRQQMASTSAFKRPPMTLSAKSGFDLSPEATAEILKLAHDLRNTPEQHSWTICTVRNPGETKDTSIMMGDAAGIFIQIFFGNEEYAYLRNSMYLGHAGDIAALLFGDPRNMDACIADQRL
jgi:hypothetical protein